MILNMEGQLQLLTIQINFQSYNLICLFLLSKFNASSILSLCLVQINGKESDY